MHASIFTALVSITLPPTGERSHRKQTRILDIDDLDNVLYLPPLRSKSNEGDQKPKPKSSPQTAASAKGTAGLSYPGPQPILSDLPNPTSHMQTLLQPSLHDPYILKQPLLLPNIVRLAETAPALMAPVPPRAEPKFKTPDASMPAVRPNATPQLDVALNGPAKPLAAPRAESRLKTPDAAMPAVRPNATPQLDVALNSPAKPLAAPLAESRLKTPDAVMPAVRPNATPQLDVALNGPAKPLAAPLAESRLKTPDAAMPVARPNVTPQFETALNGPAKPLAAPLAESKLKTPDAAMPAARPDSTPPIEMTLPSPASTALPAPPKPPASSSKPSDSSQNLLALSPMPARRDQPVTIPPGEARGRFAISPDPNLDFPGTEPGTKGGTSGPAAVGNATSAGDAAAGITTLGATSTRTPDANTAKNNATGNGSSSRPGANSGAGSDVFPGITILGASVDPPTSRNTTSIRNPEPLQTSYGVTILASGGSGGGLPDFGVFKNETVHTVYIDMRKTVPDPAPSWTVEYALQGSTIPDASAGKVSTQADIVLPFPIVKEQPAMPAELARKYPRKMVIVFGVINVDGKMEQLSVKDSPDRRLNQIVLDALEKWTFRPARRNGEVVPAKALLGIPLWSPE